MFYLFSFLFLLYLPTYISIFWFSKFICLSHWPNEWEHFLEILKIQVDEIILPWVADGVPIYWWVPIS